MAKNNRKKLETELRRAVGELESIEGTLERVEEVLQQPIDESLVLKDQAAARLVDMFLGIRKVMLKWSGITGQSPQLDSGYIAQHLISLLTNKKGSGWRGKGLDLSDGSEVKCASSVDGVDVPRWNHNFAKPEKVDEWFTAPTIYYVLFDSITRDSPKVRVRIWSVTPASDKAYTTVLSRWRDLPNRSYNFQLHPPVFKATNVGTNNCGDLELPLMFHAEEDDEGKVQIKHFQMTDLPACVLRERDQDIS